MKKYIFKSILLITLLIPLIFTTLIILSLYAINIRNQSIYSSANLFPAQLVNGTIFKEEIYGTISDLNINEDNITFNLKSADNLINEDITINKETPILRILNINPTSTQEIENRQERLIYKDISQELKDFYLSNLSIITYEDFENRISNSDSMHITFVYPTNDDQFYFISNLIYYEK